jgi:hypothetical protein
MIGELSDTMVAVQGNKQRIAQMSTTSKPSAIASKASVSDSLLEAIVVAAYLQEVRR